MEAIKYCINRFDGETKTAFLDLYSKIDAGIDPLAEVKNNLDGDSDH
jgi:hypothetical protein